MICDLFHSILVLCIPVSKARRFPFTTVYIQIIIDKSWHHPIYCDLNRTIYIITIIVNGNHQDYHCNHSHQYILNPPCHIITIFRSIIVYQHHHQPHHHHPYHNHHHHHHHSHHHHYPYHHFHHHHHPPHRHHLHHHFLHPHHHHHHPYITTTIIITTIITLIILIIITTITTTTATITTTTTTTMCLASLTWTVCGEPSPSAPPSGCSASSSVSGSLSPLPL